ncbi:hypothetical protein SEA_BEARBQ_51 [Gordonia phage BearBQ]|nr:hypothetical protein SEA_BEARBQ_51 [Gordonia phage BearBQ]
MRAVFVAESRAERVERRRRERATTGRILLAAANAELAELRRLQQKRGAA